MRALLLIGLVIVIGAASISTARAEGLQPCDSRAQGLVEDLSDDSKVSDPGEAILSFLDLPALSTGWGLQIVRSRERFLLRMVQFRRDFRGGRMEIRPHVFGWNPVQPDPLVRTVSISRGLAERLGAVVTAEIAHPDQADTRGGFDGEEFFFYAGGKCGGAWSPDLGTRPELLADIFQDLKTQALLPTRLVQLFWEKRTVARLNLYTGTEAMTVYQYLLVIAVAVAIVVVGALPLLIAWLVSLFPKRLQRKRHFVVVSGALSYGFTCFIGVVLLPFLLLGSWVAAELDVEGLSDWAIPLDFIVLYGVYVLLNAALVFGLAVPIYLRRKWWPRLTSSIASTGEVQL